MRYLSGNICLVCFLVFALFASGCITGAEDPDERFSEFMIKVNETGKHYDDMVGLDPENATAWCYRGMFYNDNFNRYEEAMESCNKALELNPEYGLAWYLKGIIFMNMNNSSAAQLCFENATKYDPDLKADIPVSSNSGSETSGSFYVIAADPGEST
ncbi:tetratricopeptide repeat protein [Methanoplanus limicola]|uniref:Tetratricopeptide TPR_1 repeat-containing protein n=1 Tax=Methanoplanus limicola DSM 2279 TaxID=937775 RepID=H1YZB8_9EURY|nr:tetratricopeptide repeat protein [Methanoplanus limicola]EHQ35142.1 Tetratricopeptide TPR_1 repeat-containing protein [Methanoplanus limicola DSM 2279]